jgi:hypothetical protein
METHRDNVSKVGRIISQPGALLLTKLCQSVSQPSHHFEDQLSTEQLSRLSTALPRHGQRPLPGRRDFCQIREQKEESRREKTGRIVC